MEGFVLHREGDPDDGAVVQIVARAADPRVQESLGPCFFICRPDREVDLVPGRWLTPWWRTLTT